MRTGVQGPASGGCASTSHEAAKLMRRVPKKWLTAAQQLSSSSAALSVVWPQVPHCLRCAPCARCASSGESVAWVPFGQLLSAASWAGRAPAPRRSTRAALVSPESEVLMARAFNPSGPPSPSAPSALPPRLSPSPFPLRRAGLEIYMCRATAGACSISAALHGAAPLRQSTHHPSTEKVKRCST